MGKYTNTCMCLPTVFVFIFFYFYFLFGFLFLFLRLFSLKCLIFFSRIKFFFHLKFYFLIFQGFQISMMKLCFIIILVKFSFTKLLLRVFLIDLLTSTPILQLSKTICDEEFQFWSNKNHCVC